MGGHGTKLLFPKMFDASSTPEDLALPNFGRQIEGWGALTGLICIVSCKQVESFIIRLTDGKRLTKICAQSCTLAQTLAGGTRNEESYEYNLATLASFIEDCGSSPSNTNSLQTQRVSLTLIIWSLHKMLHCIANFKWNFKIISSILKSSHQAHYYNLHDRYVAIHAHRHTKAEDIRLEAPHGNTRARTWVISSMCSKYKAFNGNHAIP
jgi:hypothetical protein